MLALNSNRGPTRDLAVRKTLLHAVNKAAIVKGIFLDAEWPADVLFAPNVPYANLDLPPYRYAPDHAEQLLHGAGWKRVTGKPYRMKDGQELALDLCFVGNDPQQKAVAEVIQADLRKVGVRATLVGEEADSFDKRQHGGDFGLIFGDMWRMALDDRPAARA